MAIPDNYIDKITKGTDSRMISPAADMVRVDNDNFEGADLDEVLDELAQDINNAGNGAVNVTTNQDGTFVIHVGETDYTINLNHTHENMAKIVKCTEATLPQTLADDTIYVQVDSANPPTEIEKLYLFGLEFAGGGTPSTEPKIVSPIGTQIDFNGASTKTVTVRALNLSKALTIAVTGVTANLQTISANDAANGVQLTLTKGQNFATGTLRIYSSEVDKSWDVIDSQAIQLLTAIKLTGSQWLRTDYCPNPDTEFVMNIGISAGTLFSEAVNLDCFFLAANYNPSNSGTNNFKLNCGAKSGPYVFIFKNNSSNNTLTVASSEYLASNSVISYSKGESKGTLTFNGGTARSVETSLMVNRLTDPIDIGYNANGGNILKIFDLTIYSFIITEGGVEVRHYVPAMFNGVPGLHDTVTGTFISSQTSTPVVAIQ